MVHCIGPLGLEIVGTRGPVSWRQNRIRSGHGAPCPDAALFSRTRPYVTLYRNPTPCLRVSVVPFRITHYAGRCTSVASKCASAAAGSTQRPG